MAHRSPLRERLYVIIFGHETPEGRRFDVVLMVAILASVIAVMLDSVRAFSLRWRSELALLEWIFTIIFTLEYLLRLYAARDALRYARSFFGVVDLLAILPTYLSVFFPAGRFLLTIRVLRVLRVFRVLKLVRFLGEADVLRQAMQASRRKITVFIMTVMAITIIVGSLMYVVEGAASGFTSIPKSIYWAIVTLTTVGYGDIAPQTSIGQTLAAFLMITGYAIIAVPTGIVTVELSKATSGRASEVCSACARGGHSPDASFCRFCGARLAQARRTTSTATTLTDEDASSTN